MTASTATPAGRRGPLPSLTGLRVPLAALVFTNHAGGSDLYRDDTVNFLMTGLTACIGEGAVSYFFALSGFVLTWSFRESDTPRSFIRRRVAKIVPNHLLTWIIGFVGLLAVGDYTGFVSLFPSLVLLHSWFPVMHVVQGTNGPSWSLSAELFFYSLFPFLLPVVRRVPADRLWTWIYGLVGLAVAIPVVSLLLPTGPIVFGQISLNRFWLIAFAPPVRLIDFTLGILVARIVIEGRWKVASGRTVVAWIVGAWIVGLAVPPPYGWVAPFLVPIALLLGNYATADIEGRPTRFGTTRMVWLGEVTFAFYVTHWLVLHFAHRIIFDDHQWGYLGGTAFFVGCMAFTIALAAVIFRHWEQPLFKRFSRSKRSNAPAPLPPVSERIAHHEPAVPLAPAPSAGGTPRERAALYRSDAYDGGFGGPVSGPGPWSKPRSSA